MIDLWVCKENRKLYEAEGMTMIVLLHKPIAMQERKEQPAGFQQNRQPYKSHFCWIIIITVHLVLYRSLAVCDKQVNRFTLAS